MRVALIFWEDLVSDRQWEACYECDFRHHKYKDGSEYDEVSEYEEG